MQKNILLKLLSSSLTLIIILGVNPPTIFANQAIFFDNFSQNDFKEKWSIARGSDANWKVENERLIGTVTQPFSITEIIPKEENSSENWSNVVFSVDIKPVSGIDKNLIISYTDSSNWADLHFFNNEFEIALVKDGKVISSDRGSAIILNGNSYNIIVSKKNDYLLIELNKKVIFEKQFPHNSISNKVGLRTSTGAAYPTIIEFDNITVTSLDDNSKEPPLLKQTDPQWADKEYDSGYQWAGQDGTIGAYGCALVSATMILHAHGIATLPSGEALTPTSLNDWLKSQPDGYIGAGLLNFIAITRLTQQTNERYNTTKLEYKRHAADPLKTANDELNSGNPVILQIPGHFMVGHDAVTSDIAVKDPAYNYTLLSQHNQSLLSTRTFTPSNTDLSYLLITHDKNTTITLTTPTGEVIANSSEEYIQSSQTQEPKSRSPKTQVLEYPKPSAGTYYLSISGEPLSPYSFDLITYTQTGTPTITHHTGTTGTLPITYALSYEKNHSSTTETLLSWQEFAQELGALYKSRELKQYYIYSALTNHANIADHLPATQQKALKTYKLTLLEWFADKMSEETRILLTERLNML